MDNTFQPTSGMTFKTIDGDYGVFIAVDGGLHMIYNRSGHTRFKPELLTQNKPHAIQAISRGMNAFGHWGGRSHIADSFSSRDGTIVWERNPRPESTLKLSSSYTAKIHGDVVIVGCQEIPIEKVQELVDMHKALKEYDEKG